jgi:uncharacterized membrane protein
MENLLAKSIVLLVSILVLDLLWLNVYLLNPFSKMIYDVQKEPLTVNRSGLIVAYIALFLLALVFLPKTDNYYEAFLLGFCIYAVYDGTNYASLNNWSATFSIIDSTWGGVLFVILRYILSLI